ncbi:hypothetical protein [uncultured Ilyobacter sp.]|uniref:hypothetical protein n=1 Tax=uncultured Ilyobacter sp. TaxID=544433 RepID=UPI002AA90296|nr:hypothetical protein [uncultured Ilyobacter sp.]
MIIAHTITISLLLSLLLVLLLVLNQQSRIEINSVGSLSHLSPALLNRGFVSL